MTNHPTIHFTKMHGAGNDYIYVDSSRYHIPDPTATARLWSDRHTGIGSDGLVLIGQPSIMSGADFSMRIFNADGSEAMMCGNASRCIGKYLYERGLTTKTAIRLETLSGVKTLMLTLSANRRSVESVTVDMLQPTLHCAAQYDEQVGVDALREIGHPLFVSMGNPHCVVFMDDIDNLDIEKVGPEFEFDKLFPERVNTEFVTVLDEHTIKMRVWERGSGETWACGTGACAVAVAACENGFCKKGEDIKIKLIGGDLIINYTDETVYMTGNAEKVFDGEVEV